MDPLGAASAITPLEALVKWEDTPVPEYNIMVDDPNNMKESPFEWRDDLNRKISVWSGDVTCLAVEAIVNSTNESLSDRNLVSERILRQAGPQLRTELRREIRVCKTGDAKVTKGYKLPARFVIHTVGPKYNIKYKTAAESALFNSYRKVMQTVCENKIATVALSCIHSQKRNYPNYEGAHIAIRTVRRFLEKHGEEIEKLVFVATGSDEEVYLSLLPLYFPRNKSEEDFAAYHLPYDVGNEEGEPVIQERQIRIIGKPTKIQRPTQISELEETININEAFETSVAVGAHDFAKMKGDLDKERKQKIQGAIQVEVALQEQEKRYERWLRRARQMDLTDVKRYNCIYQSGCDRSGRPVVVIIGRYFPGQRISLERALLYFIHVMDTIVQQPYVVVYVHSLVSSDNQPHSHLLSELYNVTDKKYKKNLQYLYVVHPRFWTKVLTWFFTTFSMSGIKEKVIYMPGLEYLYSRIGPDQLDLPNWVLDYDMKTNGLRYYDPDEDQAIGAL